MQNKNSLLERISVEFVVSFIIFGMIVVSTFSHIKMLVMQDVMDSANPNHPINSPVVYKSKQKNFRTMFSMNSRSAGLVSSTKMYASVHFKTR